MIIALLALALLAAAAPARASLTGAFAQAQASAADVGRKEALEDILPVQPEIKGDIPRLVDALRRARDAKDPAACDALPAAQPQTFHFGDYSMPAPGRDQWVTYCKALASRDGALCSRIAAQTHPNLQEECSETVKSLIAKNGSAKDCYEAFAPSGDDIKSCLDQVDLKSAPPFYAELRRCLEMYPVTAAGLAPKEECLFDLAQTSRDERVCRIIDNPYPAYPHSTPKCLEALGKKP